MNDDSFRQDCADYTENIKQGRHDPEWLASAWSAHERRKMGDFDEYLENKFNDEWEVKVPEELKRQRRAVSQIETNEVETTDGKGKIDYEMDELQDGCKERSDTKLKVVRSSTMMDIDGGESEDELA